MKKWIWLTAVVVALIPGVVSADELWVKNEGGLEVTVWSDSDWQEVTVTGNQGLMGVGPHSPGEVEEAGKAKVAAVTVPNAEWLVIHADNITDYRIDCACNQSFEDVTPEAYIVKDAPEAMTWEEFCEEYGELPPPPPDASNAGAWTDPFASQPQDDYSDGGPTIAQMNAASFKVDWTGQEVWRWS
jgi:hypothetical protein